MMVLDEDSGGVARTMLLNRHSGAFGVACNCHSIYQEVCCLVFTERAEDKQETEINDEEETNSEHGMETEDCYDHCDAEHSKGVWASFSNFQRIDQKMYNFKVVTKDIRAITDVNYFTHPTASVYSYDHSEEERHHKTWADINNRTVPYFVPGGLPWTPGNM